MQLHSTLLGKLLSKAQHGTWVADVASFMQQPGRPGRDIAPAECPRPVVSLVVATGPASDDSRALPVAQPGGQHDGGTCQTRLPSVAAYITSPHALPASKLQVCWGYGNLSARIITVVVLGMSCCSSAVP